MKGLTSCPLQQFVLIINCDLKLQKEIYVPVELKTRQAFNATVDTFTGRAPPLTDNIILFQFPEHWHIQIFPLRLIHGERVVGCERRELNPQTNKRMPFKYSTVYLYYIERTGLCYHDY